MKKLLFIFLFSISATAQVVIPPTPAQPEINSINLLGNKIYNANLINTYPERLPTTAINLITSTEKGRTVYDTTTNEVKYWNGTSWKVSIGLNSFSATAPLIYNNTNGIFSIPQSGSATNGFLSSTDWNIFNNKQDLLVSNSNIKTINSISILGTGNIPFPIQQNSDWNAVSGFAQILNKPSIQAPITATAPLSFNSGTSTISIPQSGLVTSGFLATADFINFSNKLQTANNGLTATATLVELGGTLTKNTNLAGNFNFTTSGTGNVGIGTTTPTAKLEVAGQIKITGGTPGLNKVLTSNAVGLATWQNVVIPTFDATIDFSVNPNPNTAGTIFNPNTPANTSVLYISTIDGSQWTYNGTAYITAPVSADWKITGNAGTVQTNNFIGTTDNVGLSFRTNNVIRQTITNTGNVGIGITTPTNRLHVANSGFNPTANDLASIKVEGGFGGGIAFAEGANRALIWSEAGNKLNFSTGGTVAGTPLRMTIDATGNVGIGTATPTSNLQIRAATNTKGQIDITSGGEGFDAELLLSTPHPFGFNTKKTAIIAKGGIGNSRADLFFVLNSTADNTTSFTTATDAKMVIKNNGNVGIGTTAPTTKLEVAGTIKATAIVNYATTAAAIADATLLAGTMYTVTTSGVKQLFIK
jgi:hypothetical protein